jgi:hypothetical protein
LVRSSFLSNSLVVRSLALALTLPASAVADWRTFPVRDGDNASTLFAEARLPQRVLFSLMNEPGVALRLAGLQPGDTVELNIVDNALDHLRLFSGDDVAIRVRPRGEAGWRVQPIVLNAYGLIAMRIRHLEAAQQIPTRLKPAYQVASVPESPGRLKAARSERDVSTPRTNAFDIGAVEIGAAEIRAAEARLNARVEAARTRYLAREAIASRASALGGTDIARAAPQRSPSTALASSSGAAAPGPRESKPSASMAKPSTARPAPPPPTTVEADLAKGASVIAKAVAVRAPATGPKPGSACPSIEGEWLANYASFRCETEVSFSVGKNGAYAMRQKGCGAITGKIRQDGQGLSGKWRHALCKGSLEIRLGASCDAGEGTWRAAKGERLCDDAKVYPVTIARIGSAQAGKLKTPETAIASSPPSWSSESESGDQ